MSRKSSRHKLPEFVRHGASLGAIGLFSIAPIGVVTAQGADPADGGVLFEFTASKEVRASDNFDLEDPAQGEVKGITSLDGSLSSITRSRSATLGFQVGLEVGNDGFQLGDTGVDLSYMMMGQGSEFEVFADYLRRNVTSEFFQDTEEIGDVDLSVTTGLRQTYGYGARILVGDQGPLTFAFRVRQQETVFDSVDPDAVDSSRLSITSSVSAAIDAATRARVTASFTETDEDDLVDTTKSTLTAGVGISRDLGDASTVSADLNWTEIRTFDGATTVSNGLGARLAFDRMLPNGSFGASATREFTVNGPIDKLRANRQFVFPASALGVDAGIVITEGNTISPLLGVTYERLAPDGTLTVSVTQDAAIDDDDVTVLNTVGTAAYRREINALSSYRAAVSVTNQTVVTGSDTTRRIDGSLSYNRSLTDTVRLTTGYEHARIFETGENERSSNTVFVRISRDFARRP